MTGLPYWPSEESLFNDLEQLSRTMGHEDPQEGDIASLIDQCREWIDVEMLALVYELTNSEINILHITATCGLDERVSSAMDIYHRTVNLIQCYADVVCMDGITDHEMYRTAVKYRRGFYDEYIPKIDINREKQYAKQLGITLASLHLANSMSVDVSDDSILQFFLDMEADIVNIFYSPQEIAHAA